MLDETNDDPERASLVRAFRQRLESLGRAGLDRIPASGEHRTPTHSRHRSRFGYEASSGSRAVEAEPPARSVYWESIHERERPRAGELEPPGRAVDSGPASSVPDALAAPKSLTPAAHHRKPVKAPSPILTPALFGQSGFETPVVPPEDRLAVLGSLFAEVAACQKCPHLAATRNPHRIRHRLERRTQLDVYRRGPGRRRGSNRTAVRGPRRPVADGHDHQGDGTDARTGLHRQHPQMPPPRESSTDAGRVRQLHLVIWNSRSPTIRPEFLCLLGLTAASRLLETTLSLGMLPR